MDKLKRYDFEVVDKLRRYVRQGVEMIESRVGVWVRYKDAQDKIAALEKRCAELESVIRKPESNCSCSWDYVTGASPKYYCGKCGRPMST